MILGIDIGGTTVKLGLIDPAGNILKRHEASVCYDNYATPVLATVVREARLFSENCHAAIVGIGVSATGQIDVKTGVVIGTNGKIPHYEGSEIKKEMACAFGLPTVVLNDANAAILGEYFAGRAKGKRHVVMVTLGTGVGGGVIVDGRFGCSRALRASRGNWGISRYIKTVCHAPAENEAAMNAMPPQRR